MMKEQIAKFIGSREMTIVDAMEQIDRNSRGILFIVDENGCLAGSVSDGDIRRWLIRTGDLGAAAGQAMKMTPKYLFGQERRQAEELMRREKIAALPILGRNRQIEDIVFLDGYDHGSPALRTDRLSGVPVVIMAGGKGTRLYPYTKILPKPLIPIGDTPIMERIIDRFTQFGVDTFHITVNYKKGMIKSYFSELNPAYRIIYVEEDKPLGTGGSIRLIKEKFDSPLFVANCDSLILADYAELYEYHLESENDITMVSAVKNIVIPYGVLHAKENGELVNMEEKPKLSYFINTGMYIINPETIDLIPGGKVFHMTDLVETVSENGGKVGVYPVSEDSFLDMGEFDEIHRMEEKLDIGKE